jgi:hypothetical protein
MYKYSLLPSVHSVVHLTSSAWSCSMMAAEHRASGALAWHSCNASVHSSAASRSAASAASCVQCSQTAAESLRDNSAARRMATELVLLVIGSLAAVFAFDIYGCSCLCDGAVCTGQVFSISNHVWVQHGFML